MCSWNNKSFLVSLLVARNLLNSSPWLFNIVLVFLDKNKPSIKIDVSIGYRPLWNMKLQHMPAIEGLTAFWFCEYCMDRKLWRLRLRVTGRPCNPSQCDFWEFWPGLREPRFQGSDSWTWSRYMIRPLKVEYIEQKSQGLRCGCTTIHRLHR